MQLGYIKMLFTQCKAFISNYGIKVVQMVEDKMSIQQICKVTNCNCIWSLYTYVAIWLLWVYVIIYFTNRLLITVCNYTQRSN